MSFGPVQILVIGFDEPEFRGVIREELERLRTNEVVRLIDLLVVRKRPDGVVERMQHSDLSTEEAQEFGALVGALIGFGADGEEGGEIGAILGAAATEDGHVLDPERSWYIDDAIPPDSAAAIVLLEHRWAIGLRDAVRDAGGFHLADAWVHPTDLVAIGELAGAESTST
jgi:uncharacterized membrane protein